MIVKIWPIKAEYAGDKSKVGGYDGLKNAEDYIKDEEKVIAAPEEKNNYLVLCEADIMDGSFINTEPDFNRVVSYMANEDKTKAHYVTTYLCETDDVTDSFQQAAERLAYKTNKKINFGEGAVAFHLVQSFPENLNISDEEVHECGMELVKKLEKYQALICSHVHPVLDEKNEVHGKCKHNHILINAYMHPDFYDRNLGGPRKYHDCKDTYRQLQIYNDEIAIEHGLPIIRDPDMERVYSWKESYEANKEMSWKARARMDIEMYRRAARDWNDFVNIMTMEGYGIKDKTHVTYTTPDGHVVRGGTLGRQYTKESLELFWAIRDHTKARIKEDIKENNDLILSDYIYNYSGSLTVKIPLGLQSLEDRHFYYLPLDKDIRSDEEALRTYMKMDEIYDICDENGQPVNSAAGLEILRSIQDLRDEGLMERRKKVRLSEEEIKQRRLKREDDDEEKRRRKEYYENKDFVNSRNGNPYRVGLYDEDGRRRTPIELILILALIVMDKEEYLWIPDGIPEEKENEVFFAAPNWKLQNIVNAIELSRQEDLDTPAQLERRLDIVGAELSRSKKAVRSTSNAKSNMEPLAQAIAEYKKNKALIERLNAMPEGPEKDALKQKYAEEIKQYSDAKRFMYINNITSDAGVIDFDLRYDKIKRDLEALEAQLKDHNEHYRRLKKLSYSLQLAEDPNYIYGPSYPGVGYVHGNEEQTQKVRKSLWQKLEETQRKKSEAEKTTEKE